MASLSYQLFIFVILLPLASCDSVIYESCTQNFTNNFVLHDNVDKALVEMIGKVSSNGFGMSTIGDGKNTVYGLTQCRGDIFNNSQGCSDCISTAAQKLQADCVNRTAGKIWYDFCSIRYDTNNFFGSADVSISKTYDSIKRADNPEAFHDTVWQLLEWVKMSAVTKGNRFGIGKMNFASEGLTIYGMAQCTRDLSRLGCLGCLTQMFATMENHCPYQKGCVSLTGSCRLRYDVNNFILTADVPLFPVDQLTPPRPAPLPN